MSKLHENLFAGRSDMAGRMRSTDWAKTRLGPVSSWPQSLKTAVRIILTSRYPMFVWWGPELINLYNDPYRAFLGVKDPAALGRSAREVWAEIWDKIGPRTDAVLLRGEATYDESLLLMMTRHLYVEETYFTFSYSPLPDDKVGVGGIFCAVMEDTQRVVGERRLGLLRDVAACLADARTVEQVCEAAGECIAKDTHDLPFALVYVADEKESSLRLTACAGIQADHAAAPERIDLGAADMAWPVASVMKSGEAELVENPAFKFADLPRGPWEHPPERAIVMPIAQQRQERPAGVLVAGLNPHRLFDEEFRGFVNLLAGQIAAGIANAVAYEEERKRAEALAEIDRAKTVFFREAAQQEQRLRAEAELERRRLHDLFMQAPAAIAMTSGPEHRWTFANPAYLKVVGRQEGWDFVGKPIRETLPEVEGQGYFELMDQVYRTGVPFSGTEMKVTLARLPGRQRETAYFNFVYQPLRSVSGEVEGLLIHAVDATAQVIARAAMQASEQQFRTMAEMIPQLAWMANPDGHIFWYNQRWYEYTGVSAQHIQGWNSFHDPAHLPRVRAKWKEAIKTGQDWQDTFPLRGRDGRYRWFLSRAMPIRDSEGHVIRWFGTNTDITPQREIEDALRKSEERLRAALTASSTGTFRWNPHTGEFMEFDDNLKRLFGLTPEDEVRTTADFVKLVHPQDRPALLPLIEASRHGSDFEMEYRVILPDGSIRWLYDRAKMFHEGGKPAYVVGACTDTTTRKASEESRLRLATIVECSEDAIVSKDLNGIVTSWNAGAERIFGYTAAEMVGRPITMIIPPELHPDEEMILSKLRRGERIEHFETIRQTKTGERLNVSLTISPVRDDTGRVIGAAKIARDITESRKAEDAVRTSEKLASVGRLAATMAHEINNPLEAVTNLIYLASSDPTLSPETRQHLAMADEELGRVSHITRQTLGFYRESSAPQVTRVADVIKSLLLVYDSRLISKSIRLILEVPSDLEITTVRGELRQVLANILQNSLEAVSQGATIRVRVAAGRRWRDGKSGVRISVGDNGPGIAAGNRSKIFRPFFTTKKDIGTGLGLWVSKGIVERHGGNIRVRSNPTPGKSWTVTSVFLPSQAAEARAGAALKEAV